MPLTPYYAFIDHCSPAICPSCVAGTSCVAQKRQGWNAARGSPHLRRDGFHIPPQGGLLILLSLSYKQVVTLSGMPIPIPRNSDMEIQKTKSKKQFITLSTKTGICQQRHTIIGEHSLSGSSPAALRSLLRPCIVKKSLAAETQCLCVCAETDAEASIETVISPPCCLFTTAYSLTHQVANASESWALVPAPNSPVVSPDSPPPPHVTERHSLTLLLWSCCTHGFPIQPWLVLETPCCSAHPIAQWSQCPHVASTGRKKILKSTHLQAEPLHSQTGRWILVKCKRSLYLGGLKKI